MRAVVFEKFGETPTIRTVPDPRPSPDGVVVKVEATGLCRSDWHGWMGHDPDIRLPHVPGHELAGVVVAVGRNVTRLEGRRPRHRAVRRRLRPLLRMHLRQPPGLRAPVPAGLHRLGLVRRICRASTSPTPISSRLPEEMDYATAASLGCRFVTSFRAVVDQGRVTPGEWVAVHGCGGVGLSAIMIASAMGANVVAIDLTDEKLEFAKKIGAVATINAATTPNVVKAVKQITGGGAHMSMDALGHPTTCFNSISNLRRRGRHVQVGLMLGDHARAEVPMAKIIAYELEIRGSHGMQAFRYPAMMEMIRTGKLKPELLIGKKISLDEAPAALTAMDSFEGTGIGVVTRF